MTEVPLQDVVIIGGGLAGMTSAQALRRKGYAGRVTVISNESCAAYDRPPLSKEFLRPGAAAPYLEVDLAALDARLIHGHGLVCPEKRRATVDSGDEIEFGAAVIATGSKPIELPGSGAMVLRTIEDSLRLREAMSPGAHLVVVGAGWIGAEVATAAREHGCRVTVVEAGSTPLGELPAEVAAATTRWYDEAGVELLLGSPVSETAPGLVTLRDGRHLRADVILVAVGVIPELSCLEGSSIRHHRGVIVDGYLRSESDPVLAVGDAAEWLSARAGRHVWLPHWDNAIRSAEVLAENLVGRPTSYDPVPYVWSDQFGRKMQMVGRPTVEDDLVWRGSPADAAWSAVWIRGGKLIALCSVDRPRDVLQARRVIENDSSLDMKKITDPGLAIRDLVQ